MVFPVVHVYGVAPGETLRAFITARHFTVVGFGLQNLVSCYDIILYTYFITYITYLRKFQGLPYIVTHEQF